MFGLARAQGTRAIYQKWWSEFVTFALEYGKLALPAQERLVELFIVWLELEGRGSGVRQAVAAVRFYHLVQGHKSPESGERIKCSGTCVE